MCKTNGHRPVIHIHIKPMCREPVWREETHTYTDTLKETKTPEIGEKGTLAWHRCRPPKPRCIIGRKDAKPLAKRALARGKNEAEDARRVHGKESTGEEGTMGMTRVRKFCKCFFHPFPTDS